MDEKEVIDKLNEFNRFAEELFNLSFVQKLKNSGYKVHWEKGKGFKTELRGPDDEAIKAFINDIRRFFQKGRIKDSLKIQRLQPFYQSDFVEDSEKEIFNRQISELNSFNNKTTNHIINGENLTNERILEVFLYGRFSHRTDGTKNIHDKWEGIPPMYVSLKNEFITILSNYLIVINNIVYANKLVIKKLGPKGEIQKC